MKSGFVSIVGRPNAGKSTLINSIIKDKIVIVSDKPQTTRNKIQCIYTDDIQQIVFLDTPGIHKPKHRLGEFMNTEAFSSTRDVDVIVVIVDGSVAFGKGDQYVLESLKDSRAPKILCINKIDVMRKDQINDLILKYGGSEVFDEIIPISALDHTNVELLLGKISDYLKEGPMYYPSDYITDQPERNIVSEIIREKALLNLSEEIPHGVAVEIEQISKREDKDLVDIGAIIYCERDNHKKIIIGKNGCMIKKIGEEARKDIENLLGSKVNLKLWVKPKKEWRNNIRVLSELGYKK